MEGLRRGLRLRPPEVGGGEQGDAVEVRLLDEVPVHEDEPADPGPGEGLRGVGPERPTPHDEGGGLLEPALALPADRGEDHLAREPRSRHAPIVSRPRAAGKWGRAPPLRRPPLTFNSSSPNGGRGKVRGALPYLRGRGKVGGLSPQRGERQGEGALPHLRGRGKVRGLSPQRGRGQGEGGRSPRRRGARGTGPASALYISSSTRGDTHGEADGGRAGGRSGDGDSVCRDARLPLWRGRPARRSGG